LISATEHPDVVSDYIHHELTQDHVGLVGSSETAKNLSIQISPLDAIPKKHTLDKWRLIMDLSSPEGSSINDGISKEDCSFHYTSLDTAVEQISKFGKGCLMAKMDIKSAYRSIPVAPSDRKILGFHWSEEVYIDKVLPFGLCSAPIIFLAVADALLWIMICLGRFIMSTISSPLGIPTHRNA